LIHRTHQRIANRRQRRRVDPGYPYDPEPAGPRAAA
jgi:hypothetical protein